jgi:foldase protein PrsA
MKEFLKQNWFVGVIAVFFIGISIFYAYDQNKNNLPNKVVDGKDVVFSVGDTNFTADELYDELYKTYGKSELFLKFYMGVIDANVEDTEELINQINNAVSQTVSYYKSYYGYGLEDLDQMARYYYGYPDFTSYVKYQLKAEVLYSKYISENPEKYITEEFIAKHNPGIISYCLIKFDNPNNPTAEETDRLNTAQQAWCNEYSVETFAEFATKFSEDPSTAGKGGKLGYVDDNSALVDAFLKTALSLEEGQVSEWIFDENYGYFLIKCDSKKYQDYIDDPNFLSTVLTDNANLANDIVWQYAQNADITFTDEAVKDYIMKQLNVVKDGE